MPTLLDWSHVSAKVNSFRESLTLPSNRDAFTFFVLDSILEVDSDEAADAITDGSDDRGIDAIFIDDRHNSQIIHLFQIKFVERFESARKNFPSGEIDKVLSFLEDLVKKNVPRASCNPVLYQKCQDIWSVCDENHYDIVVHFCSNGEPLAPAHNERVISSLTRFRISFEEHALTHFSSRIISQNKQRIEAKLKLVEDQNFERSDGFSRGLIGTIKADVLAKFLEDPEAPGTIDKSLFEDNIRIYLGEKNEVNSKILESALSGEPGEFWYLNNGITITCDSFVHRPNSSDPLITIQNPQIVNGGQTSHALFEAAQVNFDRISKIKLLIKIIETKDTDFTNRIAEATNSQTPIRSRDIRPNDPKQLKIESALKEYGFFYERKRNQHLNQSKTGRLDALKIGQLIFAYYLREPDKSKTQSDKIFGEFYDIIFDEDNISAESIISAHKLYLEVNEHRTKLLKRVKTKDLYLDLWLIEGVFHVLFMIGVLCDRDNIDPKNYEAARSRLNEAINLIGTYVKKQKGAAAYRIFRSASTKGELLRMVPGSQRELPL